MSKVIVAVDGGKYAMKSIAKNLDTNEINKIVFRTKMDETQEKKSADKHTFVVGYNNKKVLFGDTAEKMDFDKTKTKEIHKIGTYCAVANLVEDGDEVILVVGCPLSVFNNVNERTHYKEFMHDKGEINIEIDGKKRTFTIKKVLVCPESSGLIFSQPTKYESKLVGVIDIGGLNTNCCVYDKLAPIKSTCFTTNLGANVLRNELKQTLNSKFTEINLQEWQMEHILKEGKIKSHPEESSIIISEFLQKHIKEVLDEAKKKGWDIKNLDLVFIGGGSLLLEKEIKEIVKDAKISDSADWDNAEGFLVVGTMNAKGE